jgi:hypothetical protein
MGHATHARGKDQGENPRASCRGCARFSLMGAPRAAGATPQILSDREPLDARWHNVSSQNADTAGAARTTVCEALEEASGARVSKRLPLVATSDCRRNRPAGLAASDPDAGVAGLAPGVIPHRQSTGADKSLTPSRRRTPPFRSTWYDSACARSRPACPCRRWN